LISILLLVFSVLDLPVVEAEAENSKLALITTSRGGHLGFLEGFSPFRFSSGHYMERLTRDFVVAVLMNRDEFGAL